MVATLGPGEFYPCKILFRRDARIAQKQHRKGVEPLAVLKAMGILLYS